MIKKILSGILKMITKVIDTFLSPINVIFSNLFPSMTSAIGTFNTFVSTYIGGTFTYFFSLFPPIFRSILSTWITFLIAYYTIHFTYITALKVWNIIQKIKFW